MAHALSEAYQTPWPAVPIRAEVSVHAGPAGAYTGGEPAFITISSGDPRYADDAALEMVFHEASHLLVERVERAIAAAAEAQHQPVPEDLRFKSRVRDQVMRMTTEIKRLLKLDATDKRAEIFEADKMSEADGVRLWDLFNERAYKDADIRAQASDWAFSKSPKSAREFVAEMQFYDAEITARADRYVAEARAELAKELAARKSAGGKDLAADDIKDATRAATKSKLGRAFDAFGPAWNRHATKRAIEEMGQKVTKDGKQSTVGADATDTAWKTNIDAQKNDPRARRISVARRQTWSFRTT